MIQVFILRRFPRTEIFNRYLFNYKNRLVIILNAKRYGVVRIVSVSGCSMINNVIIKRMVVAGMISRSVSGFINESLKRWLSLRKFSNLA